MNRPFCYLIALYLVVTAFLLISLNVHAAVSLAGTRLIFDGRFQEVSIEARNRSANEVLLQAWLSDPQDTQGNPQTSGEGLPFVLAPHLSRLDGPGKQSLRVLYQGVGMTQERESLLHLYVLEIPRRVAGQNALSIAIRQRINLFYRPPGLGGDPAQTAELLRWTLSGVAAGRPMLRVSNPSLFHATLQTLRIDGVELNQDLLLAPGMSHEITLPSSLAAALRLSFSALTDYGGQRFYCAQVDAVAPFTARLSSRQDPHHIDQLHKEC
jgi:P pilus assembly chaperone PapD